MRKFKWTRRKYEHAHKMARFLSNFYMMPAEAPAIVQRYWELWDRYPSFGDPLLKPIGWRYDRDDIPF